jgi:hypothetical protein
VISSAIAVLSREIGDVRSARRNQNLGAHLALEVLELWQFGVRSLRISNSFICGVAELLRLIASLRVKLYLEELGCRRLTPLSVDALVLIAFPRILEWLGQLEPAGSQPL